MPFRCNLYRYNVCKADATNALGMARGFEGGFNGYGEGEAWERSEGKTNEEGERNMKKTMETTTSAVAAAAAAAVGTHPNAVGEGRDIAALWWVCTSVQE